MFMLLTTVNMQNKKNGRGYPPFPYHLQSAGIITSSPYLPR